MKYQVQGVSSSSTWLYTTQSQDDAISSGYSEPLVPMMYPKSTPQNMTRVHWSWVSQDRQLAVPGTMLYFFSFGRMRILRDIWL